MLTRYKISLIIISVFCLVFVSSQEAKAEENTTIIIVRHAEKASQPFGNPPLTVSGEKRAETLARMLVDSRVSGIYSTNFIRTRETVNNTADMLDIEIQLYNSSKELADLIKTQHSGKVVLVAGHSNTVPEIITALGIKAPPPKIDDEFDNLFIVTICSDGKASLTHLKYGPFLSLRTVKSKLFTGTLTTNIQ